jgi:hypothetical protein
LFRRYMPLAREVLLAGWRPLPLGQVTEGEASLECFGPMAAPAYVSTGMPAEEEHLYYLTLSTDPNADGTERQAVRVKLDETLHARPIPAGAPSRAVEPPAISSERRQLNTEMTGETRRFGPPATRPRREPAPQPGVPLRRQAT